MQKQGITDFLQAEPWTLGIQPCDFHRLLAFRTSFLQYVTATLRTSLFFL